MNGGAICTICPHGCVIPEGKSGLCGARSNQNKKIVLDSYGKITSIALDPIEKKPFRRFMPGKRVLSVGSYGCNLRCSFCQNYSIAKEWQGRSCWKATPEELAEKALDLVVADNIGLAYTYNEPLIGFEFVFDCARQIKSRGLKNVVVTNGYINPEPLQALLPYIDAFNIDLKGFTEDFYHDIGGRLSVVKDTIVQAAAVSHVEVTTLVIPGKNDLEEDIEAQAKWLAQINDEIPLHISRFFPAYKMTDIPPTPVATLYKLAETAGKYLKYVYIGNV